MPLQDQNVENHPNGSIGASEKLLKVPSPQLNGKVTDKAIDKKEEEEDEEVAPTADVVVPLDGGWGWVVVIASFLCCLIVDGIVMCASMFYESLEKEFHVGSSEVIFQKFLLNEFSIMLKTK